MAEASVFKFDIWLGKVGFDKTHHRIAHKAKSGRGLALGKLPNIWGSLLMFLQGPRYSFSVRGASCCIFRVAKKLPHPPFGAFFSWRPGAHAPFTYRQLLVTATKK